MKARSIVVALSFAYLTSSPSNLLADEVAHWKLDETSGTTIADSARCNGGNTSGNSTVLVGSPTLGLSGVDGNSIKFPSSADTGVSIQVCNASGTNVNGLKELGRAGTPPTAFSISLWAKYCTQATGTANKRVFELHSSNAGHLAAIQLSVRNASPDVGKVELFLRDDGGEDNIDQAADPDDYQLSTGSLADGQWHHIAASVGAGTGSQSKLYIDGVLNDSTSAANFTQAFSNDTYTKWARLGGSNTGTNFYNENTLDDSFFVGSVDDVIVYNTALSQSDVTTLATPSGFPPVDLYLQNRIESGTVTRTARRTIYAGSNVDANQSSGDYVVPNAAIVTFASGKDIRLMPGFKVQAGGRFMALVSDACAS